MSATKGCVLCSALTTSSLREWAKTGGEWAPPPPQRLHEIAKSGRSTPFSLVTLLLCFDFAEASLVEKDQQCCSCATQKFVYAWCTTTTATIVKKKS